MKWFFIIMTNGSKLSARVADNSGGKKRCLVASSILDAVICTIGGVFDIFCMRN